MAIRKIYIIAGAVIGIVIIGSGAAFMVIKSLSHKNSSDNLPHQTVVVKKTVLFTEIMNVTVSLPQDQNSSLTSFVQVGIQFSTYDPTAIASFGELQPIIKASIISELMSHTANDLANLNSRSMLIKSCLEVANNVLQKNANFPSKPPFDAGYITNFVVQE